MKQILREEDLPLTGEFRPSAVLGAISRAKNEMLDATFLARERRRTTTSGRSPASRRRYARAPQAGRRARLRRPPPRGRPALRRVARDARAVPGSVALPPRRRVPGHEPAAVPVGPGARREAPQPRGRRRRRPVDLPLARRRHPEHPRLRARLPRRDGRQARAQLPLDAADPRRRPRRRLPQHRSGPTRSSGPSNAGGRPIQRFEAYNEEEEAEWIARQVEGLTGGRGSVLTRRADDGEATTAASGRATSR